MEDEDAVEKYKVRPESRNSGWEYEITVLSLTALRLCFDTSIKNFKISTNNIFWGYFDDAIFEIEYCDGTEAIVAIQLKHTNTNLNHDNLISASGKYSLDKYYKSFREIRSKITSVTNVHFVLYTTADYHRSIAEFPWNDLIIKKRSCTEKLPSLGYQGECFQFYSHTKRQDARSEFLTRLFIYSNQNDNVKTIRDVRNLLQQEFPQCQDVCGELLAFIDKWRKGQLGGYYKLIKSEILTELSSYLLRPLMAEPKFDGKDFRNSHLWDDVVKSVDVTFLQNYSATSSRIWFRNLRKLPIVQIGDYRNKWTVPCISSHEITGLAPKQWIFSKAIGGKITLEDLYMIYWKCGRMPLILTIENPNRTIGKILKMASESSRKKSFIVYSKSRNVHGYFENLSKFHQLSDLQFHNSELYDEICSKISLKIQDRFSISLEAFNSSDYKFSSGITGEIFLVMLEQPQVGSLQVTTPPFYIDRNIGEFHVQLSVLKYIRKEVIVIFCNLDEDYRFFLDQFPGRVAEFKDENVGVKQEGNILLSDYGTALKKVRYFLRKLPQKHHIFLLSRKLSRCSLKWMESSASVGFLKKFKSDDGNMINEDNLPSYLNNSVNVISAPAGMGKSTLINKMCTLYPENFWIVKIELNKHTNYLDKMTGHPLHYFYQQTQSEDDLTRLCFNFFVDNHQLVFFIDGFDEIAPKFTHSAIKIINCLQAKNLIQWVTTRPVTEDLLERTFNVLPLSICPFTQEDQINFVEKYLPGSSSNQMREFLLHNSQMAFTNTPLQMSMLCDTVKRKSNLTSMDVLSIYQNFVEMKFDLCEERYLRQYDSVYIDDCREILRQNHVECHQVSSLIAIFGRDLTADLITPNIESFFARIREGREKNGIIVQIAEDNSPMFIHQTYAEYFAASWLASNTKLRQTPMLLLHVFKDNSYSMLRMFFDKITCRGVRILDAILNNDSAAVRAASVEDLRVVDGIGRNALHLACSWRLQPNEEIVGILMDKGMDPTIPDDLLNYTAVNYADSTRNIAALNRILQRFHIDLSQLEVCRDVERLIDDCIKDNCIHLLTQLAQCLNSGAIHVKITAHYDDLLFTAVESDSVEIIQVLLRIREFKRYIRDVDRHGNAALQLAIILSRKVIAKKLLDVDFEDETANLSPLQIVMQESTGDVKRVLEEIDDSEDERASSPNAI